MPDQAPDHAGKYWPRGTMLPGRSIADLTKLPVLWEAWTLRYTTIA
jgi:hypothetical protein